MIFEQTKQIGGLTVGSDCGHHGDIVSIASLTVTVFQAERGRVT